MRKETATIDEIARIAKVSKTTVSRYINGKYEYMSADTRKRIEEIIADKDYKPSNIARSMKSSSTRTLGCVVADISNPITSIIIQGILDAAREFEYSVLFSSTNEDEEKERASIESFLQSKVDGLLVNLSGDSSNYLTEIQREGTSIVLIDRVPKGELLFDCVRSQNEKAVYECMDHLHEQGYKSVAFFHSGMKGNQNLGIRLHAYQEKMEELFHADAADMLYEVDDVDFRYVYETERLKLEKSIKSVEHFLSRAPEGPKAIFAVSATTALSTLWALQKMGLDDFPQLGFCSFNDWGTASIVKSGITTITQDAYAIGYESSKLLFQRINGHQPYEPTLVEVPNRLVVRNSTKRKEA